LIYLGGNKVKLLSRYNEYYNDECSGLPHGGPISMETLQSLALKSAIYAFARKYGMKESIPVEDLKNLADLIEEQGNEFLKKHQTLMKEAQGHPQDPPDAL
jgi:hypothetical protein